MKPIALYGAGGLGREVLMLIHQINLKQPEWQPIGFFDDNLAEGETVHGLPVLGGIRELNTFSDFLYMVIAVGCPEIKHSIRQRIQNKSVEFATLIHPTVEIHNFQQISIGEGSIVTAGNTLTCDIELGDHVLLNLHCTVGHDVKIGSFSSLMPGCHISGNVTLEEEVYLGTGASIINGKTVGNKTIVGAGAVVVDDLEAGKTFVGVPAKPLQKTHKI